MSYFDVRIYRMLTGLGLLCLCNTAWSAAAETTKPTKPTKPPAGLDTALVRGHYLEGDFDPAIDVLETHLTLHRVPTHEDSVFAFKHLGVMYAAKYETREKGKYYMLKLLETEPTARILDMYASDMIYMIFKNIQDEYLASRRKFEHADRTLAQKPREDKAASINNIYIYLGLCKFLV